MISSESVHIPEKRAYRRICSVGVTAFLPLQIQQRAAHLRGVSRPARRMPRPVWVREAQEAKGWKVHFVSWV
ncbi:hypothetical protein MLD38_005515 [Melastoma candidum]|uniref:Uncharacterized protein n=1 Tax=Melastoma candidum TaxID=119954 RepID=A0ACB9RP32_9MYRT|nr:hypothetical protein MLD38_005515 [Melastoma candidum]